MSDVPNANASTAYQTPRLQSFGTLADLVHAGEIPIFSLIHGVSACSMAAPAPDPAPDSR